MIGRGQRSSGKCLPCWSLSMRALSGLGFTWFNFWGESYSQHVEWSPNTGPPLSRFEHPGGFSDYKTRLCGTGTKNDYPNPMMKEQTTRIYTRYHHSEKENKEGTKKDTENKNVHTSMHMDITMHHHQ